MEKFIFTEKEIVDIQLLLKEVSSRYQTVEEVEFLMDAPIYAHELPRRLRAFLNRFKQNEDISGACVVSGYPVDQQKIGKTPHHWKVRGEPSPCLEEEIFLLLCGNLLGEPFGWSTQQNGYILNNVVPIKEHETEQLGSGSKETLIWHTEDYYHPYRGDYLALFCLRNHDNVPTIYAPFSRKYVNDDQFRVLFESRFIIYPDQGHTVINRYQAEEQHVAEALLDRAYEQIEQLTKNPQKVAILSGSSEEPYMRIDPTCMDDMEEDKEAQSALRAFIRSIDAGVQNVVLQPGDIFFIDNFKAVHGRGAFQAKYDGTDRWLKRINITRDLRKSRGVRTSVRSRVVF